MPQVHSMDLSTELRCRVETTSFSEGDVLVFRFSDDLSATSKRDAVYSVIRMLEHIGAPKVGILVVPRGGDIEHVTAEQMEKLGWRRADAVQQLEPE